MNRKYDPLVTAYSKWLFQYIDLYDWGYWSSRLKSPITNINNEDFSEMIARRAFKGNRFTKTKIQKNITKQQTFYYRSDKRSKYALIMLDIDGKNGEEDVSSLKDFIIRRYHRGVYSEPSTSGTGHHIYILINRKKLTPHEFNDLLSIYRRSLRKIIVHHGFKAVFDKTGGNYSLTQCRTINGIKRYSFIPGKRGILAKVPYLPQGWESLDQLKHAPIQTPKALQKVIKEAEKLEKKLQYVNTQYITYNIFTSDSETEVKIDRKTPHELDAFIRTHNAYTSFITRYGRKPYDEVELRRFYEDNNYGTGVGDSIKRQERCRNVFEYRKTLPNPTLKNKSCTIKECQRLVEQYVKPECYKTAKIDKGRSITHDDLAIGLYVITRNSTKRGERYDRWFTTGNDSIIEAFSVIKMMGKSKRGCNTTKSVAIKNILCNAGLIYCLDNTWFHGGPKMGRCKKFGLGINHPLREAFLILQEEHGGVPVMTHKEMDTNNGIEERLETQISFETNSPDDLEWQTV